MYTEARKINIIEEVLKADDEETLRELEAVIKKRKGELPAKKSLISTTLPASFQGRKPAS